MKITSPTRRCLRNRHVGSVVFALAATTLAAGAFSPAQAQLFADDQARQAILNLRQEVANLREEDRRARIQLASQIEQLQQQISQLRGQIETLSKQVADGVPQRNQAQAGSSTDPAALLNGASDEQALYDKAIDSFRKENYKAATEQFSAFLSKYSASQLAPTAQFYLGSSLYAQKEYQSAITQLQAMVKNWPDNARAPDALLVIAGSQIELRNYNGAKSTLQRIIRDYPNAPAAATARERLKLLQ